MEEPNKLKILVVIPYFFTNRANEKTLFSFLRNKRLKVINSLWVISFR